MTTAAPRRVRANSAPWNVDPMALARMAQAREEASGRALPIPLKPRASWWRRFWTWLRLTLGLLVPAPRSR